MKRAQLILGLLVVALAPPSLAQKASASGKTAATLTVIDANNRVVGRYENGVAYTLVNGSLVALPLGFFGEPHLLHLVPSGLHFLTPDCSGPVYTNNVYPGALPTGVYRANGQTTLHVATGPGQTLTFRSSLNVSSTEGEPQYTCSTFEFQSRGWATTPVVAPEWVEPLRLN
jgi:hypothetical protein